MRPFLDTILEHEGLEGVISFLKNTDPLGIFLTKEELETLSTLITELKADRKNKKSPQSIVICVFYCFISP